MTELTAYASPTIEGETISCTTEKENRHEESTPSQRSRCCFQTRLNSSSAVDLETGTHDSPSSALPGWSRSVRQDKRRARLFKLALFANGIFLLGSILQVLYAHGSFDLAQSVHGYPVSVVEADDDATWQAYMAAKTYQERRLAPIPLDAYEGLQWNYLPADVREALHNLWHTEKSWDGNPKSQLEGWDWNELDKYEKPAAEYLGFDEVTWDTFEVKDEHNHDDDVTNYELAAREYDEKNEIINHNETTSSPSNEDSGSSQLYQVIPSINASSPFNPSVWQEKSSWETIPKDVRDSLVVLGYYEELWGAKWPAFTADMTWNELSPPQQEAAVSLGYSQGSWNEIGKAGETVAGEAIEDDESTSNLMATNIPASESTNPVSEVVAQETTAENTSSTEAPPLETSKPETMAPETNKPKETPAPTATQPQPASKDSKTSPITTPLSTVPPTPSPTKSVSKPPKKVPKTTIPPVATVAPTKEPAFPSKSEYFDETIVLTIFDMDVSLNLVYLLGASLCFLVAGAANWIREAQVFHIWIVQGSICMTLSALITWTGFSESGAVLFRALAYHCYLVQVIFMLRLRKSIRPLEGLERLSLALWAADAMFGSSVVVSIVGTYWQFLDHDAVFDLHIAHGQILAAWLWLLAAALYVLSPFVLSWETKRNELLAPLHCSKN